MNNIEPSNNRMSVDEDDAESDTDLEPDTRIWKKKAKMLLAESEALKRDRDRYREQRNAAEGDLSDRNEEIADLKRDNARYRRRFHDAEDDLSGRDEEIVNLKRDSSDRDEEIADHKRDLAHYRRRDRS